MVYEEKKALSDVEKPSKSHLHTSSVIDEKQGFINLEELKETDIEEMDLVKAIVSQKMKKFEFLKWFPSIMAVVCAVRIYRTYKNEDAVLCVLIAICGVFFTQLSLVLFSLSAQGLKLYYMHKFKTQSDDSKETDSNDFFINMWRMALSYTIAVAWTFWLALFCPVEMFDGDYLMSIFFALACCLLVLNTDNFASFRQRIIRNRQNE